MNREEFAVTARPLLKRVSQHIRRNAIPYRLAVNRNGKLVVVALHHTLPESWREIAQYTRPVTNTVLYLQQHGDALYALLPEQFRQDQMPVPAEPGCSRNQP